jgi:TPR repeat protein
VGEAEGWYRRAAQAGDAGAMHQLSLLLERQGQTNEAARWRRRADAGA